MVLRKSRCTLYGSSVWQNWNGNRNVAYLDHLIGGRDLYLFWRDDVWNERYRFATVSK